MRARLSAARGLRCLWRSSCQAEASRLWWLRCCSGGTGFFLGRQAGEKEAGVALLDVGLFFLAPLPPHGHCGAGAGEVRVHWRNGRYGTLAELNASVVAFQTYFKKGEPFKARLAPLSRWGVFSLVPTK